MNDNGIIPIPNDDTWDICKPRTEGLGKPINSFVVDSFEEDPLPIYRIGIDSYKENGGGIMSIYKDNKLIKTEDMEEVKEEIKEVIDVKDLEILGLSIDGKSYTVKDNLQLETFISLNALIKAEGAVLKAIYEKDVEIDIKPAEAFHVASLLLNFTKKKQYILEVNKKMKIHISNKKTNTENKIAKRRNKKKLDRKFKK
jgi:hypothetical protein